MVGTRNHRSAAVAILGNIAFLASERLRYNPETNQLDKRNKNHLLTRTYRKEWPLPTVRESIRR